MPNGSLLKQYLPTGVMTVVRSHEEGERGICQNPLLASSLEKILAPLSHANVSLTFGSGCTYFSEYMPTLLFNGLRSTQMQTSLFFLGTTTIPAHQGVGCDTLEITPAASMRL